MPTPPRCRWFQFSLRTMFVSTAIVAIGFAVFALPIEGPEGMFIRWSGEAAIVGAGILLPLRQPALGASLGLLAFVFFSIFINYNVDL